MWIKIFAFAEINPYQNHSNLSYTPVRSIVKVFHSIHTNMVRLDTQTRVERLILVWI